MKLTRPHARMPPPGGAAAPHTGAASRPRHAGLRVDRGARRSEARR
jgi:hypothetical protein